MLITCEYCGNKFERSVRRCNEAIKMGWKQFCSPTCLAKSRITSIDSFCSNPLCRKLIHRQFEQAGRSALLFCSTSCSAIYYNAVRKHSCKLRKCERPSCQNYIHSIDPRVRFCCRQCVDANRVGTTSYTADSVLSEISNFAMDHDRIPTRNELGHLNRLARRFFGTWNKAIKAAGFDPNPVMFAKHYIAKDGHKCDSLAEKIVDDWLSARKIKHEAHVPYPWKNGMSADFVVGKIWIELFGLTGELKRYDELKKTKLKLAKEHEIKILPLSLKDVYKDGLEARLGGLQRLPS